MVTKWVEYMTIYGIAIKVFLLCNALLNVDSKHKGSEESSKELERDLFDMDSYVHPHEPSFVGIKFRVDGKTSTLAQELVGELVTSYHHKPVNMESVASLPRVPLVTAVSSNHFAELVAHIKEMPTVLPNKTIIVYDLGLKQGEIKQLQCDSLVRYRKFNFTRYPEHVQDLHNYAWKPLILQEVLRQFGAGMWMDSSIVIKRNYTHFLERMVQLQTGFLFYLPTAGHSIVSATHPKTFQYFPMARLEAMTDEMSQGGGTIIFNTAEVRKHILRWVILCSLHKDCIAPEGSKLFCGFHFPENQFGGCHRYDQAVLSIIVGNAYNYQTETYRVRGEECLITEIEKV